MQKTAYAQFYAKKKKKEINEQNIKWEKIKWITKLKSHLHAALEDATRNLFKHLNPNYSQY